MTSQLRHFFQASQAVHGADDVTTPPFKSQVHSLRVCGPQVDTLIHNKNDLRPDSFKANQTNLLETETEKNLVSILKAVFGDGPVALEHHPVPLVDGQSLVAVQEPGQVLQPDQPVGHGPVNRKLCLGTMLKRKG